MKQKDLLLKDLCARLPYGVWIERKLKRCKFGAKCMLNAHDISAIEREQYEFCKPYLFPLSSMTEEQLYEVSQIIGKDVAIFSDYLLTIDHRRRTFSYQELDALFNWFDKNHFDYRNLIEKGLAIDATSKNIY